MKILVADDNPQVRAYIASVFIERGHAVHEVADGAEALLALDTVKVDAVLMDLSMPNLSGVDATRRLRQDGRFTELPIFAFTGMSDLPGFDSKLFTRTFLKPYPPASLVDAIEKELANR